MRADAPIFVPSFLKETPRNSCKVNEKQKQRKARTNNKKDHPHLSDEIPNGTVHPDSKLIIRRKQRSKRNRARPNRKKEEKIDSLTDKDQLQETILFDDLFPSLAHPNVETATRGKPTTTKINWSHVALDGHIKSEKSKAAEIREKLRLQHEIDTCTRLDVLQSSRDVITLVSESNESNNDLVYYNSKEHIGPFLRIMNMEKLRQRWIVAFEEKRKKDEENAQEMKRQALLAQQRQQQEDMIDSIENHTSDVESVASNQSGQNSDANLFESEMKNIQTYLESPFPLHSAVLENDENAILNLLSLPSDVTLRDTTISVSSLHLLKKVALPKPFSRLGKTCSLVQLAVMLHRPNILRLLLSKAVNRSQQNIPFAQQIENLDDFQRTPLMFACEFELDGCINVLLSFGAKVNSKHKCSGDTPLHIACRNGHLSSVVMILKSISSRDESSIAKKKVEIARLKLISTQNVLGETPIHIICKTNEIDILDAIANICNSSSIDKALSIEDENGNTPLMVAIASGAEDIVMNLSQRRYVHKLHNCPLIAAVESNSLNMVQILLECRSTLTSKDFDYNGALCMALTCFQDQGEDLERICKLLIAEGANPHVKPLLRDPVTESSYTESALTIAALQGNEEIVSVLLNCYNQYLIQKMKILHLDPVLLNQPKAYFQSIKERDEDEVQTAMRECIVRIITSEAQCSDHDFGQRLKCCLRLFRRDISLDSISFARILKCVTESSSKRFAAPDTLMIEENIFSAAYDCVTKELPFQVKRPLSLYDEHVPVPSIALLELEWITEEWSNVSLSCPWLQNELFKIETSYVADNGDICMLVVEGRQYKAHKSILKRKSGKLSAAISFHETRYKIDTESSTETLVIPLEISERSLRLLIEHIYHGSIISGLPCHPSACCELLFDLYYVAQEYMCPTLAQEVEMRLLSSDPYFCSCRSCCMHSETISTYEDQCVYQVKVCFAEKTLVLRWYQSHFF